MQYAKKHLVLQAELSITVEGENLLEKISYNFNKLMNTNDGFEKLRFKYFQVVEGQITLPGDFTPQQLVIDAKIKRKKSKAWQRKLNLTQCEKQIVDVVPVTILSAA